MGICRIISFSALLAALPLAALASLLAFISGYLGLLLSYHGSLPSGPAIVLTAGVVYGVSVLLGPRGGLRSRYFPGRHRAA